MRPSLAPTKAEEPRRAFAKRNQNPIELLRSETLAMRQASHVASQFLELVARNRDAEILARDILHVVRLVEDHGGVVGDDRAAIVFLHREIGEKQVMIDDDHVAFLAFWCIFVMKQRSNCGHFWPVHRSPRASILAHAGCAPGSS